MKRLIIIFLIIDSLCIYGQETKSALDFYNDGVKAFSSKDYKLADSLFSISSYMQPHPDTYFNLAFVKQKRGDTCGFCNNLENAIAMSDLESKKIYNTNCFFRRTVQFPTKDSLKSSRKFSQVTITSICNKDSAITFYKLNTNNQIIFTFYLSGNDTIFFPESDTVPIYPDKTIYTIVDKMPSYPNGTDGFDKFIEDNLVYPQSAIDKQLSGKVFATFVIAKNGNLTNPTIIKGEGTEANDEVIRVLKLSPKWTPGIKNNRPVNVKFMYTINFNATKKKKNK